MRRASFRVESERSLRSPEAIRDVVDGVVVAKDLAVRTTADEGITGVTFDELAEYVSATVQRRLSGRAMNPADLREPRP